ncbi:MAG: DUF3365 domain-containing protein [Epsilonproteobacteria bacterium]|nr:DUF3365 domain-containing protein [Campylobacterota bacterium]
MKKLILTSLIVATSVFAQNDYNKKANEVSKELLKTLGGNLKKELKSNGPVSALKYCSANAYNLTEKVSKKYGEKIDVKRISLKPRNPANSASKDEAIILKSMEEMYKVGVKPKNIIQEKDGKVIVYKPLIIKKKACIICHGDVAKNKPKLAKEIKNLYPADKATGYKMGDLRGAIVVTFEKKEK